MSFIFNLLLSPLVWIPCVVLLVIMTIRNYKKVNTYGALNVESVLLMMEIPKDNDKKELAAEQLFASLHGILRDAEELKLSGGVQEHLSFEIASIENQIRFYVWVPKILQSFVEGQIYAQYPSVQIYRVAKDYVDRADAHPVVYSTEITLTENEVLPIKTFENFEVDPLAGITGTLAKLNPDSNEEMWIQILVRPVADSWHEKTDAFIKKLKDGKSFKLFGTPDLQWFAELFMALWRPPEGGSGTSGSEKKELSDRDKARIAKAEEKASKLGFQVKIRVVYVGDNEVNARLNMQALVGSFKQFNLTNFNGFKMVGSSFDRDIIESYQARQFTDEGYILNISELASVYHLPHTNVETPNIVWATSKTAEPPSKLPMLTGDPAKDENISAFGLTDFRGIKHQFGMLRRDRSRHIYIIGQTGSGKSGLLTLFALSDIYHNQGYCIIDPHGDLATDNLKYIPTERLNDVVYFNPADTQYPMAFNPLEISDPNRKPNISSEVIGVLKRMFGDSWGPRLEHILRYTLLALLDRPYATLLDISRMLTDKDFRKETLDYCQDVTVLQFWKHEFGSWSDKQVTESVAPVLNKVGAFTANPIIRNIIGQAKSSFDVRKIMDEGKILVVNLSKGLIGEDNAAILGAFLVTKVQLAAMSRSDIERVEDRRPFYLYVDEFQNFATDSFAVILSEARKYGLNLTVANQYTSQMTESVRDAVFGNVGTTISFRVSADDAPILSKQFEPTFEAQDLLNLNNRHFVISMIIGGEKVPAFSATTLNYPKVPNDQTSTIIRLSREHYARPRSEVEAEISAVIGGADKFKKDLSDSGRAAGTAGSQKPSINSKSGFAFTPSPQAEFKKQKLSPNQIAKMQSGIEQAAENNSPDKQGNNGLKNLGTMLAAKQAADAGAKEGPTKSPAKQAAKATPKPTATEQKPIEAKQRPIAEQKPIPQTPKSITGPYKDPAVDKFSRIVKATPSTPAPAPKIETPTNLAPSHPAEKQSSNEAFLRIKHSNNKVAKATTPPQPSPQPTLKQSNPRNSTPSSEIKIDHSANKKHHSLADEMREAKAAEQKHKASQEPLRTQLASSLGEQLKQAMAAEQQRIKAPSPAPMQSSGPIAQAAPATSAPAHPAPAMIIDPITMQPIATSKQSFQSADIRSNKRENNADASVEVVVPDKAKNKPNFKARPSVHSEAEKPGKSDDLQLDFEATPAPQNKKHRRSKRYNK